MVSLFTVVYAPIYCMTSSCMDCGTYCQVLFDSLRALENLIHSNVVLDNAIHERKISFFDIAQRIDVIIPERVIILFS